MKIVRNSIGKIQCFVSKKTFLSVSLGVLLALYAIFLRWPGTFRGADTPIYLRYFKSFLTFPGTFFDYLIAYPWLASFGYLSMNSIIAQFSSNESLYLYIITTTILILMLIAYRLFFSKKELILFGLSIVMLIASSSVYFYSLNILRQGLMTPFLIMSLYYLIQDNRRKSILYLFFGLLFHMTAILFLPVILLYPKYKQWNKPLSGMVIALLLSIFINKHTMLFLINLTGIPFLILKASNYFHKPYFQSSILDPNILIKLFITSIILVALKRVYRLHHDEQFNHLYLAVCLFFSIILLFFNLSIIPNRLLLNSSILMPLIFARSIYSFRRKTIAIVMFFILSLFYGLLISQHPSVKANLTSKKMAHHATVVERLPTPNMV